MASWKSLLCFTERFAIIDQIASTLKLDPDVQHSQAILSAQAIESECFNNADSKEHYASLWLQALQALQANQANSFPLVSYGGESPFHSPPLSPSNGGESPFHSPSPPGITLGAYTPCHHTASGIFSTIYRAPTPAHITADLAPVYVALKLTTPSTTLPPHDSRREARILIALGTHSNIIPLLETFTLPPSTFILVFPFLPHTLTSLLSSHPPHSRLLGILHDTARALAWVHAHGVLHRDVKPSNILLSHTGTYLADFGIAWSPTDSVEPADAKITDVGTTAYRPPELLFGYRAYGVGLDMWSYGCTVAGCFIDGGGETAFFDAGDLGSDLRLVGSIFMKLGTPAIETWPEAAKFPDFGKILFHQFPKKPWEELLPGASASVRDLVGRLLVYESGDRISAEEVLGHEAFKTEG